MPVSLLAVVVSSVSLIVVVSPVSKIRVAIEPLAENVSPPVAFVVVLVVVFVVLVAFVLAVPVAFVPVVFCATAGARLNAAAKSPKTSTSVPFSYEITIKCHYFTQA
jgi:hypothetical protein